MSHFPKSARLLKSRHFKELSTTGEEAYGRFIVLQKKASRWPQSKLGVTVSKRFGKAHERNRFKRITREAFRLSRRQFLAPLLLHIRPRSHAQKASMQDIQNELLELIQKTR